jgi:hypothetical protein
MRSYFALLVLAVGLGPQALAQSCTGLCLQQVTCPNGGTTTITGTVYAPNGTDPLPNITVYIPNAAVEAFTPGVSCPVAGQPPSGSPLVGTMTANDGTFTLYDVPVGSNIPLVIQSGRWRRQVVVPSTAACTNTPFSASMPANQSQGDIPKIAIATGSEDSVECVLRKIGISDTEFTDPSGSGRINIFLGSYSPGVSVDSTTPSEDTLMGTTSTLNQYDVLMLPCEGKQYLRNSTQLANIIQFANSGGRVYASHYGYVWMFQNPPFSGVADWDVGQSELPDGLATVNTNFTDGETLSQWLQLVGASTTQGQIEINTVRHDTDGVIAPTQSWLTYNDTSVNNPVMQFTFDTPIGATAQCGRVLFNEYHVEDPGNLKTTGLTFPGECSNGAMTPQEKLLEFSLFSLTGSGGQPTLTPATENFGNVAIGFSSAPQPFTWTNNTSFAVYISSVTATGDYAISSNGCSNVASGSSCQINVVFTPTALGQRTGTLTAVSEGNTLTASLTGTGVPALSASASALNFGNVDVGASSTQAFTITNNASGAVSVPGMSLTGTGFISSTSCGATLAAGATCQVAITFSPTATGPYSGTWSVNSSSLAFSGLTLALTGTGVDFSFSINPTSGQVIAGNPTTTTLTTTPISGFNSAITLNCITTAPASLCTPAVVSFIPATTVTTQVIISTTSQYTVVGYSGFGKGLAGLFALASTVLLWRTRRRSASLVRYGLLAITLTAATFFTSGCSGKYPALNSSYTPPGTYTYTLTATDGFLVRQVTYTLKVTAN